LPLLSHILIYIITKAITITNDLSFRTVSPRARENFVYTRSAFDSDCKHYLLRAVYSIKDITKYSIVVYIYIINNFSQSVLRGGGSIYKPSLKSGHTCQGSCKP
jgi:hypothetical protein